MFLAQSEMWVMYSIWIMFESGLKITKKVQMFKNVLYKSFKIMNWVQMLINLNGKSCLQDCKGSLQC